MSDQAREEMYECSVSGIFTVIAGSRTEREYKTREYKTVFLPRAQILNVVLVKKIF